MEAVVLLVLIDLLLALASLVPRWRKYRWKNSRTRVGGER